MLRQFLFALLVSLFVALGGLVGCGEVDADAEHWCRLDAHCECDEEGDCCITEGGRCYAGQCCDGLVCGSNGHCVPE